ncbi:MAG: DNA polymerase III subunit alpha [Vulcanimicrobiaceae bacterium]
MTIERMFDYHGPPMAAARYAELHSRSNFSFHEGGSHPEELVERAVALGLSALALTDRDGVYGAVRFSKAAKPLKLSAITGAELTLDAPELRPKRRDPTPLEHARFPRLVLLAENEDGYANLARAISTAQMRGKKRDARLRLADLDGRSAGLIALSASAHGYAEEALLRGDPAAGRERAAALRDLFPGRYYLEVQHHLRPEDARLVLAQVALAEELGLPYVATNGAAYAYADDALLCDVLTCIKHKTTLQNAGTLLLPNHEFFLKSPAQMARIFAPYPRALFNTLAIAERCVFRLERLSGQFPLFPVPPGESTHSYLRTLVFRGARKRYGEPLSSKVERQLEYELGIIARMDLAGYFLVVWDIARAAENLKVLAQGRGSAANSAVCYALGITAVDPVGMELLFERFLSEERNEIPDIDIDFAHQDREKVIQYVYDRYGREHAAMTAEIITYHTRSAIRDVGKALGLSLAQVDAVAKEYDARESLAGALGTREDESANGEPESEIEQPHHNAKLKIELNVESALPNSVLRRRDLDTGSNVRFSRTQETDSENDPSFKSTHSQQTKRQHASEPTNEDEFASNSDTQQRDSTRQRVDPTYARARAIKPKPGNYYGFTAKDFGADPEPELRGPLSGNAGELLLRLCRRVDGFPRHLGIHSGGMVLTRDPLVQVAPVEWATMRNRSVVQWDKDDLADLGLIKIDLLGLGMLSLLRDAFALFERRYAETKPGLSLASIPADDPATYAMLQQADTIGVFQIESRAQQSMLPRMKPTCFYDIVMQVAIIRPGPIQGDMIHPFLRRRNGLEPVTYPHPKLKPILERTLGVPLFQEQGMRMAIEAGGFSPGQADQLRRAMGHKRSRARMAEIYPKLVAGMVDNGIDREAADKLFHMLEGFADYGFPESHAASFALLSYASAYVKCHEPAVFLAAILNVQPMGFYSTEVLVNDARRHAVTVKAVAVNASEFWSFVDAEGATRLGFHVVRGLGEGQREPLQAALAQGPFGGLEAFAARTGLSKGALENLAIVGAFAPWFATRRDAMWAVRGLDERSARGELGREMDVEEPAPGFAPLAALEETAFDVWGTGLTTGLQPIAHFRAGLDAQRVLAAARLAEQPNHLVCKVGGMVITRQRPSTAKGFVFLTLEDETGLVNVIVKPSVYERNRRLIRSATALIIEGTLQKEQGCVDVLAKRFWPLDTQDTTAGVHARNFH